MKGAQEFVSEPARRMGFKVEVVQTDMHPIIFAERGGEPSWPHVVIYGHYDVQPADPLELWKTPPFEPTVVGDRIYGRGAADNKGPLMTNIAAVAQLLEANPQAPLQDHVPDRGRGGDGEPQLSGVSRAIPRPAARRRISCTFPTRRCRGRTRSSSPAACAGWPCSTSIVDGREDGPALGPARRGAAQPDPGAGGDRAEPPHAGRAGERARVLRRRPRRRALGAGRN